MEDIAQLLTKNISIWVSAETTKNSGRGKSIGNKDSFYGVQKLRELIYNLAISGKLLPQDNNDISAIQNLNKNKSWKLVEGQNTNYRELPKNWALVSMDTLAADVSYPIGDGDHGNIKPSCYTTSGIPYIRVADLGWGSFEPNGLVYIPESVHKQNLKSELKPNDILIAKTGATIGKCCIVPPNIPIANTTASVGKLTLDEKVVIPKWIIVFFLSSKFKQKMWSVSIKTAQPGFNVIDLKKFEVPIPPLSEQNRIIEKVDQLIALCDQLEQQQIDAKKTHEVLVTKLLATLTQKQTHEELLLNWQLIYSNFADLFTTEASVDVLEQTLLKLLVMGKLHTQNPNDEPARELINRIKSSNFNLTKKGKITKQKPLLPIEEEEKTFELPFGWERVRLGELYIFEYGDNLPERKRTNTGEFPVYGSNGIVGSHNECFVKSKCIVIGRKGSAGALNLSLANGCCVTDVSFYCIPSNELDLEFSFKLFQTIGLNHLGKGIKPGLNRNDAYNLVIAIPPYKEQLRINSIAESLTELCGQLKSSIKQLNQQKKLIADTSVSISSNKLCA